MSQCPDVFIFWLCLFGFHSMNLYNDSNRAGGTCSLSVAHAAFPAPTVTPCSSAFGLLVSSFSILLKLPENKAHDSPLSCGTSVWTASVSYSWKLLPVFPSLVLQKHFLVIISKHNESKIGKCVLMGTLDIQIFSKSGCIWWCSLQQNPVCWLEHYCSVLMHL